MAHPAQLLAVAVLAAALIVTGLRLTRERRPLAGRAPAAWVVLLVTLAVGGYRKVQEDNAIPGR